MILDVFTIALLLSLILRKRIFHLDKLKVRATYLFPVPFIIQILPFQQRGFLMAISYGLLFVVLILNWKISGFKLMAVGSAMNVSVILLNNGKMPVYEPLARMLGLDLTVKHTFVSSFSEKLILGDWIPVVLPWFRKFLISPGDILIYTGVFMFFLTSQKIEQ